MTSVMGHRSQAGREKPAHRFAVDFNLLGIDKSLYFA